MNAQADMDDLRRRADGVRNRIALSSVIGADVTLRKEGKEHVGLCPFHADANIGSFSINDAKAIFKCFACGVGGDHFVYLEKRKGLTFMAALRALEADAGIDFSDARAKASYDRSREKRQRAAAKDAEKRRRNAVGLWAFAALLAGSPAEKYLAGRGIDFGKLGRYPGAIRYRHDAWCSEAKRAMPAMVTAMTSLDGVHMATHRTYLEYRRGLWVKAPLDKPKKVLGDFAHAHISLSKGDTGRLPLKAVPDGTAVAVSEGIEDGLTVAMADPAMRVLAATSLDNIGGIALPDAVSDVILVGQNDEEYRAWRALEARRAGAETEALHHEKAGHDIRAAFERQIARLQERGRTVACLWPDAAFKDFNDELRGMRMREAR